MPYTVSTPVFEGPFDLLLHLISSDKVELWEVSLADIVDGYVATLAEFSDGLDLETATEFLLIAAVLLELKTRRLLPGRESVEAEEEFALWEERDLLVARLLECKTFKDASRELERRIDNASRSWPRRVGPGELYHAARPDVMAGVTPERLRNVMQRALEPKPAVKVELTHVAPVRVSVADAVAGLVVTLPARRRVCFADLVVGVRERLEVIVCFLAVLELYKQGCVDLEQATSFGTLEVIWLGGNRDGAARDPVVVEDYEG